MDAVQEVLKAGLGELTPIQQYDAIECLSEVLTEGDCKPLCSHYDKQSQIGNEFKAIGGTIAQDVLKAGLSKFTPIQYTVSYMRLMLHCNTLSVGLSISSN